MLGSVYSKTLNRVKNDPQSNDLAGLRLGDNLTLDRSSFFRIFILEIESKLKALLFFCCFNTEYIIAFILLRFRCAYARVRSPPKG